MAVTVVEVVSVGGGEKNQLQLNNNSDKRNRCNEDTGWKL